MTQSEAHSIFSRAAIQRLSITSYPSLSRGGSSSLLSLLASEADERSVRRGELAPTIERNYQSAHISRRYRSHHVPGSNGKMMLQDCGVAMLIGESSSLAGFFARSLCDPTALMTS